MLDWNNTVIYKICCKDQSITNIFIGYTTNIKMRKYSVKQEYNNEYKLTSHIDPIPSHPKYVFQFMRQHGGYDNWNIEKVCDCPCSNEDEAIYWKRYYINSMNATLNFDRSRINP